MASKRKLPWQMKQSARNLLRKKHDLLDHATQLLADGDCEGAIVAREGATFVSGRLREQLNNNKMLERAHGEEAADSARRSVQLGRHIMAACLLKKPKKSRRR